MQRVRPLPPAHPSSPAHPAFVTPHLPFTPTLAANPHRSHLTSTSPLTPHSSSSTPKSLLRLSSQVVKVLIEVGQTFARGFVARAAKWRLRAARDALAKAVAAKELGQLQAAIAAVQTPQRTFFKVS